MAGNETLLTGLRVSWEGDTQWLQKKKVRICMIFRRDAKILG
jgi:hypothetical protein